MSDPLLRVIGIAEILGAVGLILPALTRALAAFVAYGRWVVIPSS